MRERIRSLAETDAVQVFVAFLFVAFGIVLGAAALGIAVRVFIAVSGLGGS